MSESNSIGSFIVSLIGMIVCVIYFFSPSCSCEGNKSNNSDNGELYYESEKSYTQSVKHPWIVGQWYCETPHGAITLVFNGDGQYGTCSELMYGSYKIGTYSVEGNTIRYKLDGESWSNTVEICDGHRLHLGDGYYLRKK